ncbi:DUF6756 family protein [Paenibacillus kandeliae]|uniref:DUF6756 family protein n=1 Tax=Paenibacillus kandeliae TaxID=3231269 RepID=UPI00345B2811
MHQELEEACSIGHIRNYKVDAAEDVIRAIESIYVDGAPRAWWLRLQHVVHKQHSDNDQWYVDIKRIVRQYCASDILANQKLLFVVDEDNERHHVYALTLDEIIHVIAECRFFEYYICPNDYAWLLCENEHGEFLICKCS